MGEIIRLDNDNMIDQKAKDDMHFAATHPPIKHYSAHENIWIHINKDLSTGRTPLEGGIEELVEPDTFFFMNLPEYQRRWYLDYYREIEDDINVILDMIAGRRDKFGNRLQEFIMEHVTH